MGVQTQIDRIKNEVDDQTNLISQIKTSLVDKTSLVKHASTHATGGSDPITPASIGAKAADESDVFIAIPDTTTNAEIKAALDAGKAVFCKGGSKYPLVPFTYTVNNTHYFVATVSNVKTVIYTCEQNRWNRIATSTHASTHATGGSDPITPASIGAKAADESDVLIAIYGTTTNAEIEAAYQAGKTVVCVYRDSVYYLSTRISEISHIFSTIFSFSGTDSSNSYLRKITCISDVWESSRNLGFKPEAHASNHATGGSDPITPASIGAAPISTTTEVALAAASWRGDSAPYTYTLTVNGVTDTSTQEIVFATSINLEQLTAGQNANIQDGGQSANTIVLKAWGEKPTVDLPIRVIMRG